MPSIGRMWSRSMQTPTTTMRAWRGAPSIILSITPGTPTHSKNTPGRRAGPSMNGIGGASAPRLAASLQLSYGEVVAGSTTTSAPIFAASARRAGEKSDATIGDAPRSFKAAMTASPIGPQPITSGTSSG